MPKGWVKVGDEWNPTKCRKTSGIEYNVWYIERYGDKPVGTEMTVCTRTPTPEGWKETGRKWNPTTCHPNDFDNVKTIKRVE
jgi:hypothetical protein